VFTVTELARLLGVQPDTVRHYTSYGLLFPRVNALNGYRFYSESDAVDLLNTRAFRSLDIPLEEVKRFGSASVGEQAAWLDGRRDQLRAEIAMLESKLERLEEVRQYTRQAADCRGQVVEIQRDPIHSLYTMGAGKAHTAQKRLVGDWVSRLPYTHISVKLPLEELNDPDRTEPYSVELGIGVVEKYAAKLGLSLAPPVESIPGGLHLAVYLRTENLLSLTPQDLRPLLLYARERGFRFLNNTSGRLLAVECSGGRKIFCFMLRVRVALSRP